MNLPFSLSTNFTNPQSNFSTKGFTLLNQSQSVLKDSSSSLDVDRKIRRLKRRVYTQSKGWKNIKQGINKRYEDKFKKRLLAERSLREISAFEVTERSVQTIFDLRYKYKSTIVNVALTLGASRQTIRLILQGKHKIFKYNERLSKLQKDLSSGRGTITISNHRRVPE